MTNFGLSQIQAQAILDMQLQRLTGLERPISERLLDGEEAFDDRRNRVVMIPSNTTGEATMR